MTKPERATSVANTAEIVSLTICGQAFGLPVMRVQDVLASARINRVPLAPPEVAGSLNLRGRIVTAIDLRVRLGLPPRAAGVEPMCIIVDCSAAGGELYALLVDEVGDVLSLDSASFERNPVTLKPEWRAVCRGLYRLDGNLLLLLDIDTLVVSA